MNELTTRHGLVTYRRVYGDWTNQQMSRWRDSLSEFSLTPMQQFANTKGKNATDSFLIIDAMDILYEGNVEGFCIVSSDSDFTRLASRLRDAGKMVIGMGEKKTPRSFRAACNVFTTLELLLEEEVDTDDAGAKTEASATDAEAEANENTLTKPEIAKAIVDILNENNDSGRQTTLSEVGNRLVGMYPDFDVRSFGYSQLSRFIESFDNIQLVRESNIVYVSLRNLEDMEHEVHETIHAEVAKHAGSIALSQLGQILQKRYPSFSVKDYGYSKLSKFVRNVDGVTTHFEDGITYVVAQSSSQKSSNKRK